MYLFKTLIKRVNLILIFILIFEFIGFNGFAANNDKIISLRTLLDEMIDRASLSYLPQPQYSLKQFSSYDRKSVSPNKEGWWANEDWTQFLGADNKNGHKEYILFDVDGPGAIVRFWMTFSGEGASDGILRIYTDNDDSPVIEGKVLDIISGHFLAPDPISSSVSHRTELEKRGHNLYLPIPYSKHCKITYECKSVKFENNTWKPSIYYNIDYRTYNKGTKVKSITKDDLIKLKPFMEKSASILLNSEVLSIDEFYSDSKILSPSEELSLNIKDKNMAISRIGIKINANNIKQALRSTVLKIVFDKYRTVWVPIGEFFGMGYQLYPSKTWFTRVYNDGEMASYWVMPFKENTKISIINYGKQKVNVDLSVSLSEYEWKNTTLYFGAFWREYNKISTAKNSNLDNDEWHYDLNFIDLKGKGVYVGDAITVFNTVEIWWGEGDEKIYVDGESFPSSLGTGTEDYYGYAWCRSEVFSHPFIAQPTGAGNFNTGMTVNLRFRSLDTIPFKKEINANIEMWHWVKTKLNYAITTFFYIKPDFTSNVQPDIEAVKRGVALKRTDVITPVIDKNGIIEGESLEITSYDSEKIKIKYGTKCSGKSQLWWENASLGAELKTKFILNESGKYKVRVYFTKGNNHGKVNISLNGKTIKKKINTFGKEEGEIFLFDLGVHKLKKGDNTLCFKLIGKNKSEKTGIIVGIDYLKFEKLNIK